jgi:hypothetical protein
MVDVVVNEFVSAAENRDINNVNGIIECKCCVKYKHTLETVLQELSSARKIIQLLQEDGGQGLMIAQNTGSLNQMSNSTFSWCSLLSQTESMTTEYRRDISSIHY